MAFSQGSITATLTAKISDFQNKMKRAEASLTEFGSKGKQLQDRLDDLSRRKDSLLKKMQELESAGKQNSSTYRNLSDRAAKYTDAIATQNLKISEFIGKNKRANEVLRMLSGGFSGLKSAANSFNSFVRDTLVVTLGNILADSIRGIIELTKEMTTGFIRAGMQTEQQAIAFEVLTGSVEDGAKLMKQINKFAVGTPFDIAQIRDVTKLLLAFNISSREVIPTLAMLGDITAGTGGQLDLLAKAYAQTKSKGKLYAQEINQFAEQGVGLRDTLAAMKGVGIEEFMRELNSGSSDEIVVTFKEMDKALRAIHKNQFIGLLGRQADTARGRFQNLQETISLIGQRILGVDVATGKINAGSVSDKITKALKESLDFLSQNEEKIVSIASSGIDNIFAAIKSGIQFISDSRSNIDAVMNRFDSTMQWMKENQDTIIFGITTIAGGIAGAWVGANIALITTILTGLVPSLIALTSAAAATIISMLPFIAVGLAVGAVIGGVIYVVRNWDQVLKIVTQTILSIPGAIAFLLGYLVGFVVGVTIRFFLLVWNWLNKIINFFANFPTNMRMIFVKIAVEFVKFVIRIGMFAFELQKKFSQINWFQIGKDVLNGLWNGLKNVGANLMSWWSDFASGFGEGFKDALGIQSPSKLFEYFGNMIGDGLKVGLDEKQIEVGQASQRMLQTVTNNSISNTNNNQRYVNVYNYGNSRNNSQVNPNLALS